jgi:phage antirepressor YoqD-like protein
MRELIERARQAKKLPAAEAAIEINRRRMEARRKLEQMVATVEFNDPFIDFTDVFMSREQLMEARQAATSAEDRIVAMARGREIEALK